MLLASGIGSGYEVQKGGKLTAIGGNAESESGDATGGDALWGAYGGIVSAGETTLIGGNAKSGSGEAIGGDAINGSCDYFTQVTVKEGRRGSSEFDLNTYKANNPELVAMFGDDNVKYYEHYIASGKAEGRTAA